MVLSCLLGRSLQPLILNTAGLAMHLLDRVVRKPINANPRLKVNRGFNPDGKNGSKG